MACAQWAALTSRLRKPTAPAPPTESPALADESPASPIGYRFEGFELRLRSRELLRQGAPVELQPKVFDLIVCLIERRDRAVDKNELLDLVWPRQVVTEAALSRSVMKARRALDDDADQPRLIRTVHARGYQFMAEVEPVSRAPPAGDAMPGPTETALDTPDAAAPDRPLHSESPAPAPTLAPRAAPTRWPGLTAALVVMLAGLSWIGWRQIDEQPPAADAPLRIAVLPFENRTGDASLEWMRLGMMSAIEQILREGGHLPTVPPPELLRRLTDQPVDDDDALVALRSAHQATHLVVGEIHAGAGNLRLAYRVLPADGRERRRSLVGADLPELARGAGADLLALLGRDDDAPVGGDDLANEAFVRGRALALQGELADARRMLALAVEQSPDAFWPRYELALVQRDLGDSADAVDALEALRSSAQSRGDLRQLRAAANSLGIARMQSGDLDAAGALFAQALDSARASGDPLAAASAQLNLSIVARRRGDLVEARRQAEAALAEYPRAGIAHPSGQALNTLAQVALAERRYEEAGDLLRRAIGAFRLIGDRRNEAVALNASSRLARQEGDLDRAVALAGQALAMHRLLGERRNLIPALTNLSRLSQENLDLAAAERHAEEAREAAERLGEAPMLADALRRLAEVRLAQHRLDDAAEAAGKAVDAYPAAGEPRGAGTALLLLADVARRSGDAPAAAGFADRAAALASGHSDRLLLSMVEAFRARLALDAGDIAGAEAASVEAGSLGGALDDPRPAAIAALRLAQVRLAQNRDAEAGALLDMAAAHQQREPEWLSAEAERRTREGDRALALALEEQARERAGASWSAADEARLKARRAAAEADAGH